MLGAGLEPACLSAYAPQTYVSAIPPPELCARASKLPADGNGLQVALLLLLLFLLVLLIVIVIKRNEHNDELQCAGMKSTDQRLQFPKRART
jgi:hypothetical protein